MWLESMSGGGILNIKFNDNISTEKCTFYFGGESYVSSQLYRITRKPERIHG